jgi:hypothetical protein
MILTAVDYCDSQGTLVSNYLENPAPIGPLASADTLQRRVRTWKAPYGEAPEVMFELCHEPGGMGILDFTELKLLTGNGYG